MKPDMNELIIRLDKNSADLPIIIKYLEKNIYRTCIGFAMHVKKNSSLESVLCIGNYKRDKAGLPGDYKTITVPISRILKYSLIKNP